MKVINQHENIGSTWLIGLVLASTVAASADVIRQTVSYPPETVAGWANIHFGGDDATGLSFEMTALGFETGGTMFLKVHPSQTTEVLLKDWGVLPLQAGDAVSLAPVMGQWGASGLESFVFSMSYTSFPESPPPGRGVGMPGYGGFMGVRFLSATDWHYGWVRFGPLDTSPAPGLGWPSLLEYAYETVPNTPILIPEPSARALFLSGCGLFCFYARRRTMG